MKIVLDVFGGDHAPESVLKGAQLALEADKDLELVLCGKTESIELGIFEYGMDASRVEIVEAPGVITNDDIPTRAVAGKKDSSLVVALNTLNREDVHGFVSAGSTGAVLTGAVLITKRIKGIARPALAPVLPTVTGGSVLLIDCGANIDCKPPHLIGFALMGSAYMKTMYGMESPRVALLSNGTEDKKGNALNRETFPLLKELEGINFVGNMEARDILSGQFDVVVTDGFAGNVALKSLEGTAKAVFTVLRQEVEASFRAKLGVMFMNKALRALKQKMDYTQGGGAVFLGVEKVIVKAHGASKSASVCAALIQAKQLAEAGVVSAVRQAADACAAHGTDQA